MFATILCSIVFGGVGIFVGLVVGVAGIRTYVEGQADAKVTAIHKMLNTIIGSNLKTIEALKNAMETQGNLIKMLRREKKQLVAQLEDSTEAVQQLEGMLDETIGEDDEDSEEVSVVATGTKQHSIAADKIQTLKGILTDAAKKGEQVNPETLLGIVNFKME